MKEFAHEITRAFEISDDAAKFAVVTFESDAILRTPLTTDTKKIYDAIDVRYLRRVSDTGARDAQPPHAAHTSLTSPPALFLPPYATGALRRGSHLDL